MAIGRRPRRKGARPLEFLSSRLTNAVIETPSLWCDRPPAKADLVRKSRFPAARQLCLRLYNAPMRDSYRGPAMTLGNMHALGITSIDVTCQCGREANVDASVTTYYQAFHRQGGVLLPCVRVAPSYPASLASIQMRFVPALPHDQPGLGILWHRPILPLWEADFLPNLRGLAIPH
jgi:hypothetical protein